MVGIPEPWYLTRSKYKTMVVLPGFNNFQGRTQLWQGDSPLLISNSSGVDCDSVESRNERKTWQHPLHILGVPQIVLLKKILAPRGKTFLKTTNTDRPRTHPFIVLHNVDPRFTNPVDRGGAPILVGFITFRGSTFLSIRRINIA